MFRGALARPDGLVVARQYDEPFEWQQIVALAHGVKHQGYCHLVDATTNVVMFGGMCRYKDDNRLRWMNVNLETNDYALEINFERCKNCQFRQGNKFVVASNPHGTL